MYDRFNLVAATKGPAPREHFDKHLIGYCNIALKPPFTKHIALVAPAGYPVAVFSGKKDEDQSFYGVYCEAGSLSQAAAEGLKQSDEHVLDFIGTLECVKATLSVRGRYGYEGLMQGTAILVTRGQQVGPFLRTFGGSGPKLTDVSR